MCKLRLTTALLQATHIQGAAQKKLEIFKQLSGLDEAGVKKMENWEGGSVDVLHIPTNLKNETCCTSKVNDLVLSGLGNYSSVTEFVGQRADGVIALMLKKYQERFNVDQSNN